MLSLATLEGVSPTGGLINLKNARVSEYSSPQRIDNFL